ncbi:MAG TPA: hypothetical protein VEU09_03545 [Candidatus Binatia bacterium]|nr:hypothetical protein [Candidatus Binatia bacterium]
MVRVFVCSLAAVLVLAPWARAAQPLETETARTPRAHEIQIDATFERQTSEAGREIAAPLAVEYGLTDRIELLLEPVFYTSIRPAAGPGATGMGDLEATLTAVVRAETQHTPALAAAFEVKIPTTQDPVIGTGETDYTGYLIASRRVGPVDAHLNFGYSVLGRPPGVALNNIFTYAGAAEWTLTKRLDLVGEMIRTTAALPEGGSEGESGVAQEVGGAETVGMIGARLHTSDGITFALGVSYDNNQAWLVRPGVTLKLR